jgi:hypothetical protein
MDPEDEEIWNVQGRSGLMTEAGGKGEQEERDEEKMKKSYTKENAEEENKMEDGGTGCE